MPTEQNDRGIMFCVWYTLGVLIMWLISLNRSTILTEQAIHEMSRL